MDRSVALAHVDGDVQLLGELAAMFVKDYPRFLNAARDSIERGDGATLEREAHTMKGRLAFFGVFAARDKALDLEMAGRRRDLAAASQILAEIESAMARVLPELEALCSKTPETGRQP